MFNFGRIIKSFLYRFLRGMSKKPILYKGIIPFPLGLPMVRYPRRNNAYYLINFRKWDW